MKYGRDVRLLSSTICCGSNGMFKLLFDAMIYELYTKYDIDAAFLCAVGRKCSEYPVELKAAENFNTIFLAIESSTGAYMNEK